MGSEPAPRVRRTLATGVLGLLIAAAVGAVVIYVAGSPGAPVDPAPGVSAEALVPGTALPTGAECAAAVRATPEVRPENAEPNARTGGGVRVPDWTPDGYAPEFNRDIVARIDGDYAGSTSEILQWGACKWGLPLDLVLAMADAESDWRQATTGDISSDGEDCVPGDEPPCATSFGIMQVKHLYRPGSYPLASESTAFNVDYALGVVRGCYEGWVTYLGPEAEGDLWGCVGWHFSGELRDPAALEYIGRVERALDAAAWTHW
ncbi:MULTISPECIES: hypothetical protein [unclassified Pseudonocardia]|uniref:hypothetical protein n=1 Tax=unclassified Pseudonocardia TaxID=2619320 RepID=UPI0001FFE12D|nr:hypothetical protein [Pseudonocardia sp. Ae707_Ps1]OLM20176.1 hypothetical protein Ae707Ps1_4435c [Pseudonocardia sp. Ae707_Ps1]